MKPLVGLSLMHETEFLNAALPLFISNEVEVIEWSFDTILYEKDKPKWLKQLLKEYSANNRLIGHGVRYSLFDAKWTKRQEKWLGKLKRELKNYSYSHITEHYGFMSSSDFHKGAPLPVPLNKQSLAIGIDRLKRISEAAKLPVGVENLAFSFSKEDVKNQGKFLKKLIEPVNGFLILDLHNIYCQSQNFKVDFLSLVKSYPLELVREIHISGGSWQKSIYSKEIKNVRRDTHDEKVPEEIFNYLPKVLKLCPNLEYVIFERLGNTLKNEKECVQFRKDFIRIKKLTGEIKSKSLSKAGKQFVKKGRKSPLNDLKLYNEQQIIISALKAAKTPFEALNKLENSALKEWNVTKWNLSMVETAISLMKKWS